MTLQQAAKQGLRELRRLHVEAGECSHPHECPVVKAITDLELALGEEWAISTEPCTDLNQIKGVGVTVYPMTEVRNEVAVMADLRDPRTLLPETLAAIGRMRCHPTQNDLRGQESAILSPE